MQMLFVKKDNVVHRLIFEHLFGYSSAEQAQHGDHENAKKLAPVIFGSEHCARSCARIGDVAG